MARIPARRDLPLCVPRWVAWANLFARVFRDGCHVPERDPVSNGSPAVFFVDHSRRLGENAMRSAVRSLGLVTLADPEHYEFTLLSDKALNDREV